MKINKVNKNDHKIIFGTGTHEEVESLNIAKDFETALILLAKIRNKRKRFFDIKDSGQVDRAIYGTRKIS
ncbi:MAG: hypothetical protein A2252_12040 [Elusimicrobia bacterium RIFOXYA2_FULL_39_19]|nr:MAG: hypothetical protein A2252_12040 [Elusimicrobia bacterium RIFOXYA2_FULL_39_19]